MSIQFSINELMLVIVEQSRKREIKYRMSMCFMPLRFKVQVRNKSFRVPLMARVVLFINHRRYM